MRIAAPLLALLVLLAVPAVAVAGIGPAADPAGGDAGAAAPPAPSPVRPVLLGPPHASIDEPEVTEFHIDPDPGGDARWSVSVRYNLTSAADRDAFSRYGQTFESGDAAVGLDAEFFRTLAAEASRATGREMSIQNVERNATVRNETGVLRLSFTWTAFVTETEDGFLVEDAVLMPGNRTWLSSIGPSQRLVVDTPSGYQVTDTRFGLDNGSVVVQGPHQFRDPLTISYQQSAPEEPPEPATPWSLIGGALLVALGLVVAAVYVRRRGGGWAGPTGATDAAGGAAGSTDAATATDPGTAETAEAEAAIAEADATGSADEGEGPVDPSLLSDEERVERLLDRNGGRMKQARIVRETGWSDAKVSQLLSTMADDGRVEKLRLGRENLISLPDEEP